MRRTGGIIPPGKAGLIMLAAALVPVVVAAIKPHAKKLFKTAGDAAERVMDSSEIAEEEVQAEEPEPKKAKKGKKSKKS